MKETDHLGFAITIDITNRHRSRPRRLLSALSLLPKNFAIEVEGADETWLNAVYSSINKEIHLAVARQIANADVAAESAVLALGK